MPHDSSGSHASPLLEITPEPQWSAGIREAWQFRELFYFLIWRDVKVRYKQTFLGVLWALLQPMAMMLVFALFLGRYAHVPSNGAPYALMFLAALVPWQLFAHAVGGASDSLVTNEQLVTKVYFPRMIVPASAVGAAGVDYVIGLGVVAAALAWYRVTPTPALLLLIPLTILAGLASFGVGLGLAALNVRYRDVRHAVGFVLQLWMFLTPVVYPMSVVPPRFRLLYALNPMAGIVEGVRWSLLHPKTSFPIRELGVSIVTTLLILAVAVIYFRRMEDSFADTI
jgi:lipopolysaccharide transport system permease protein